VETLYWRLHAYCFLTKMVVTTAYALATDKELQEALQDFLVN